MHVPRCTRLSTPSICKCPLQKRSSTPTAIKSSWRSISFLFDELSPDHLMAAIDLIADPSHDYYDSRLQKQFGGKTMLDDDEDELDV